MNPSELIIFTTNDGKVSIQPRFSEETVWLTLDQLASLFDRNKSTISRHISNVFDEGELERSAIVAEFATVAAKNRRRKSPSFGGVPEGRGKFPSFGGVPEGRGKFPSFGGVPEGRGGL